MVESAAWSTWIEQSPSATAKSQRSATSTQLDAEKKKSWNQFSALLTERTCVDPGPCNFAHVMIIPHPSSLASPGGCGGTENS